MLYEVITDGGHTETTLGAHALPALERGGASIGPAEALCAIVGA